MTSTSKSHRKTYWFIFQNERLLVVKNDSHYTVLTTTAALDMANGIQRQHLLSRFDDFDIYCAELHTHIPIPDHLDLLPLRKALELLGEEWYNTAAKAYAIINWDKNHLFCGRCGQETIHQVGTFERLCPSCSLNFYPRISPSIIVLIHNQQNILMARGHHFLPGAYGLIAGFVEAGETIENAVHREVKEEVGITIKNLRYYGSQAWPFPDSLMLGFIAEYASGELVIDHNEIETAGWYPYNQLPGLPSTTISLGSKLIQHFLSTINKTNAK